MASETILMITGVDCALGKEGEFNEWYNTNFAETMSKVPGVVGVERYERVEENEQLPRFISIVELENMEAAQAAIKRSEEKIAAAKEKLMKEIEEAKNDSE